MNNKVDVSEENQKLKKENDLLKHSNRELLRILNNLIEHTGCWVDGVTYNIMEHAKKISQKD